MLKTLTLDAHVAGLFADVRLTALYTNDRSTHVEASFSFDFLDARPAVYHLSAQLPGGTTIEAVSLPKQAALDRYDDAISAGEVGYMLSLDGSRVLLALGSLPPQQSVAVTMSWLADLPLNVIEGAELTLPVVRGVPTCVTVHAPEAQSLSCPSDAAAVVVAGPRATYKGTPNVPQLLFQLDTAHVAEPRCVVERDPSSNSLLAHVSWVPRFPDADAGGSTHHHISFVLDRSGSMAGARIDASVAALQQLLRALPSRGTYFNVFSFGSSWTALFDGHRAYDEQSLTEASAAVARFQADMGGTELMDVLQHVLALRPPGSDHSVVVLTDGDLSNGQAYIDLVLSAQQHTRVHTIGVGNAPSRALLESIAEAGSGGCHMCDTNDRGVQRAVALTTSRMLSPFLDAVQIGTGDLRVQCIAPAVAPKRIFHGQKLSAFFLLDPSMDAHGPRRSVSLKCTTSSGQVRELAVPVDLAAATSGITLHRMFVVARCRDPNADAELQSMACSYGLATALTHLVMVDSSSNKRFAQAMDSVKVLQEVNDIKLLMTSNIVALMDRGALIEQLIDRTDDLNTQACTFYARSSTLGGFSLSGMWNSVTSFFTPAPLYSYSTIGYNVEPQPDGVTAAAAAAAPKTPVLAPVAPLVNRGSLFDQLVVLQRFDGSWLMSEELVQLLQPLPDGALAPPNGCTWSQWATALVLAILALRFPEMAQEWGLLAKKAHTTLPSADVVTEARRRLGTVH